MTGRKIGTCVLVLLVIALGAVQAETAEKIQYKLKLEKGRRYYMRMVMEQQVTQTMMGREQQVEHSIGLGADFDVNDVDGDGNAWVNYIYRWVKFTQKSAMGQTEYDSAKKDSTETPMSRSFGALLGEGMLLKITPGGRVSEVKNIDKMCQSFQEKFSTGPIPEKTMDAVGQFFSEQSIKESTDSLMAIYPDKPVGVGDSWSRTMVISTGSPMIIENKWTLKDRKGGIATIDVNSVIMSNPDAKPMEMGALKMSYQLSGTQTGQLEMQESTGRIIRSKMNREISEQIVMSNSSGQSMPDMTIPRKVKGVETVEMTEREEQAPGAAPSPVPN